MGTVEKWRTFWANQDSPLHPSDNPEFCQVYASELKILFGEITPTRVLEIGCGNGALFEFLGFDRVNYKGVDFSPRLLAAFKAKHPSIEIECCEGSSYVDRENKYELIFSNEVIQDFDMAMLDTHFACARSMMYDASMLVCASIPWRLHRSKFDSGRLTEILAPSLLRLTKAKIARVLFGDSMGRWYEPHEIVALAKRHGFSVNFYGSMVYFYRFHAVLRLK